MKICSGFFVSTVAAFALAAGLSAASAQDGDSNDTGIANAETGALSPPPQVDFSVPAQNFGELPPPVQGDLLISPGDFGGTCTCAVTEPPASPIDCEGVASQMRAQANTQRKAMVDQCVSQTLDQCEAQQGPQACAALPAALQSTCNPVVQGRLVCAAYASDVTAQCTEAVDGAMQRDFTPVLNQQVSACRAQRDESLAPWRNWCETTAKPQSCGVCDAERADIATIEAEIESNQQWISDQRDGVIALDDNPNAISERLQRIRELQDVVAQKRENFALMQETGYCPTESEAESG